MLRKGLATLGRGWGQGLAVTGRGVGVTSLATWSACTAAGCSAIAGGVSTICVQALNAAAVAINQAFGPSTNIPPPRAALLGVREPHALHLGIIGTRRHSLPYLNRATPYRWRGVPPDRVYFARYGKKTQ